MPVLQNMTIKRKLTAIIMLTCIVALLAAGAIFIAYNFIQFRQNMAINLLVQAEMMADNCKAALAFDDPEDAEETLSALHVESSIVYACIRTKDNKIFATYQRDKADEIFSPLQIHKRDTYFISGFLSVSKDIILDGETIGSVSVTSNLSPMYAMLRRNIAIITAIVLLVALSAYFIASRLQAVISRPVLSLAGIAKKVSEEKNYSIRAQGESNDEIGLLIDSFNGMLEQIQLRDSELTRMNEVLEEKVKQRTAHLSEEIEQRKQAEQQLKAANQQLETNEQQLRAANRKLEESNQQLQQFVYVASHDLREPIRKISSFGQLLTESMQGKLDEDEKENFTFMIDGANRMQQMIEALLTYSRVTTKAVEFKEIDLNETVEQLRSFELAVKLEETGGCISVPQSLPVIKGDPAQIRQLLQNLIGNALKYHKKDIVPEVIIRACEQDNGMIKIEVEDNGIGIKDEQCENVFVMFKRLHSRQEYDGTGIGLAVCKKIVERHNGKIGVNSTYGKGSVFWFILLPELEVREETQKNLVSSFET